MSLPGEEHLAGTGSLPTHGGHRTRMHLAERRRLRSGPRTADPDSSLPRMSHPIHQRLLLAPAPEGTPNPSTSPHLPCHCPDPTTFASCFLLTLTLTGFHLGPRHPRSHKNHAGLSLTIKRIMALFYIKPSKNLTWLSQIFFF